MDCEIYRDGAGKLKDHLQANIQAFYGRHGRLPVAVIVGLLTSTRVLAGKTMPSRPWKRKRRLY